MLQRLEAELEEKMLESSSQSNLTGAGLLVETLVSHIDQAIIFDKSVRTELEKQLFTMARILEGTNADAKEALERLHVFRSYYQSSSDNSQIV